VNCSPQSRDPRVSFDSIIGFDVVAHQDTEAEICDNEFVDPGQQVCGK
jgi:hypothetical protein